MNAAIDLRCDARDLRLAAKSHNIDDYTSIRWAIVVEKSSHVVRSLAAAPMSAGLATRLAAAHLGRSGVDAAPLLRQVGLSGKALEHGDRVDVASQIRFLELAAHAVEDDFLGITLAEGADLRELGMLYYVAASSHSAGDAFRRMGRFIKLGNEALTVKMNKHPCSVDFAYAGVARHLDRHQMEFFALLLIRMCRQLIGQKISPRDAQFIHHRSGDLRRARISFGCEVDFGADADEMGFDPALLDLPLVAADPFLNRLMVAHCEQALAAARPGNVSPFRVVVENAIAPLLPHAEAGVRKVAKCLGLSERSFARRLAADGLSFGGILDEMRRELAVRYLEEPGLQVSQIAWLLGFRQPSAFSHACRRWTGRSPSQYRSGLAPA